MVSFFSIDIMPIHNEYLLFNIHIVYSVIYVIFLDKLEPEKKRSLENISRALRYFAVNRNYGYIDRLANAYSIITLRQVVSEIMRDLRSEHDRGEPVYVPNEKEIEDLLTLAEKDMSIVKIVAARALAYPGE